MSNDDKKYTVSLNNKTKKNELKGYLDNGDIDADANFGQEISTADDSNHTSIIDGWISNYGGENERIKKKLEELKKKSSSERKNFITEKIDDGKSITFFIVAFPK